MEKILVRALATFHTTMERNAWPKDHLLDSIIVQCRQWVERREEETTNPQQEN